MGSLSFFLRTSSSTPCAIFVVIVQANINKLLDCTIFFQILGALDLTQVSLLYSIYPDLSCVALFLLGFLLGNFALLRLTLSFLRLLICVFTFLFFLILLRFHFLVNKIHQNMCWRLDFLTLFIYLAIYILRIALNLFLRALLRNLIRLDLSSLLCLIYNDSWTWLFLLVIIFLLLLLLILFLFASSTHFKFYL